MVDDGWCGWECECAGESRHTSQACVLKLTYWFTMTVVLKCREAGVKQEGRVDEDHKAWEVAEMHRVWS